MALLFVSMLVFCEVGEKVTNVFCEFEYEIGQIKWYLFTNSNRQLLISIMCFCQKPITLDGFGSIKGSREVYKKVSFWERK